MPNYSKNDVLLVRYPFTDFSQLKPRPAVVVNAPHASTDLIIVPLTSRQAGLRAGEFVLTDWQSAGLIVPTAVKRGFLTLNQNLVLRYIGSLSPRDNQALKQSLKLWLDL